MTFVTRVVVLFILAPWSTANAQSFQGLGTLPATTQGSEAHGVSANGSVVVGVVETGDDRQAARWTEKTGWVLLGVIRDDEPAGWAFGVSADGAWAVGQNTSQTRLQHPVRWADDGSIQDLGTLPSMRGGGHVPSGRAVAVSADGSVIVGSSDVGWDNPNGTRGGRRNEAFRWEDSTMVGLGWLEDIGIDGEWSTSIAWGVSSDGRVVVGESRSTTVPGCDSESGCRVAFRWDDGTMTSLGVIPSETDGPRSQANGVSASGTVVVGSSSSPRSSQEAFRWEDGIMEDDMMVGLGIPPGTEESEALAVSADGSVIVGTAEGDAGDVAFIWTQESGIRPLRDVLVAQGVTLMGWSLTEATAISADGRVVVGIGVNPSGIEEAWRAELEPPEGLVVNDTRDLADLDPKDNICDAVDDAEEPGEQCTLRAAIEEVNERGGGEITFDIEGDPFILIEHDRDDPDEIGPLPAIEVPTTIDGTTQAGGFVLVQGHPLSRGEALAPGPGITLASGASGSTLRGLVVNGFEAANVRLEEGADECLIEGNRIGTDYTGTVAEGGGGGSCHIMETSAPGQIICLDGLLGAGLHVLSSGNRIVDNVIAGNAEFSAYLSLETSSGSVQVLLDENANFNELERNSIGYGANGSLILPPLNIDGSYDQWEGCTGITCWAPIGINVFGNGNVIGGSPEAGNRIGGNMWDVWMRGVVSRLAATLEAVGRSEGNSVSHNQVGTDAPVLVTTTGGFDGGVTLDGRDNRAFGNTINTTRAALTVNGGDQALGVNEAYENTIAGWMEPSDPLDPLLVTTVSSRGAVSIGGEGTVVRDNTITSGAWGIALDQGGSEVTVSGNTVEGVHGSLIVPTLEVPQGESKRYEGSLIESNTFQVTSEGMNGLIFADGQGIRVMGNTIEASGVGIMLPVNEFSEEPQRVLFSQNEITAPVGIDLGDDNVTTNDVSDLDDGPNNLLNFPLVTQVVRTTSGVRVSGKLEGAFSGTYTVEAFASEACATGMVFFGTAYGAGDTYLGAVEVSGEPSSFGSPAFTLSADGLASEYRYIALTSSRQDLFITSEFSRCIRLADAADTAQADVAPDAVGDVLDDVGAVIEIESDATTRRASTSSANPATAQAQTAHDGGRLYVTRYDGVPNTDLSPEVFADTTATSPDGSTVAPDALASRQWLLAETGFGITEGETPLRFRVCLSPEQAVTVGRVASVVLIQRNEETDGWRALGTTLEDRDGAVYLCANGLNALGEFGFGGTEGAFPVASDDALFDDLSSQLALEAPFPNPATSRATIPFALPDAGYVRLTVLDALGREVLALEDGVRSAGDLEVAFDTDRLTPGVYVVRLEAGGAVASRTLTVVR